jgi:hypothetical protein
VDAAGSQQRHARWTRLDPQAWPARRRSLADPVLRRNARLVLVAAVALAALAATIVVGSRLLEQPAPLPFSQRASFVSVAPLPRMFETTTAVRTSDGRIAFVGPQRIDTNLGPQWGTWTINLWDPADRGLQTFSSAVTRGYAGMAPLPGDRLLMIDAGGQFPSDALKTASVTDLRSGTTSPVGEMTRFRINFATLALADGRVLVTGGEAPETSTTLPPDTVDGEPATATAEAFSTATNRFTPVGPMTIGREGHTMIQLADGRVLVFGGYSGSMPDQANLASAELFDPASGTFVPTGSMQRARNNGTVVPIRLRDGRILVIGGADVDGATSFDAAAQLKRNGPVTTELYDPALGTFSPGPVLPHIVSSATLLEDGTVLLIGNWWESHQPANMVMSSMRDEHHYAWAAILDPDTGITREIPAPVGAPTSGYPSPLSVALRDGRVVVAQGYDANDAQSPDGFLAIFEDPRT